MVRRILTLLFLCTLVAAPALAAAGGGALAMREVRQGESMHEELVEQGMIFDDEELTAYVNEVGQRLAAVSQDHRRMEYHFFVLDDPSVNALAFPGGYIYISRGLLAYLDNESQLAAVLGKSRSRITQIAAEPVDDEAVRIARTLTRDPALRRHLPRLAAPSTR